MREFSRREALIIGAGLLAGSGCDGKRDARAAWNDLLKQCAVSDVLSAKVLFFGVSNQIGPGSIWRQMPEGGFALRWIVKDPPIGPVSQKPGTCSGDTKKTFQASAGLQLDNAAIPVGGDLKTEFQRAKSITIKPTAFQWFDVIEGEYENFIRTKADPKIREDMTPANARLVMGRALQIQGFSAELVFDSSTGLDVKGKVQEGALPITNLGFNGTAKWVGNEHLTITTQDPAYLAGELRKYNGGFAGPGEKVLGVVVDAGGARVLLKDPEIS